MPSDLDVVCLSHLRWDYVYQRPQHLMSRAARDWTVLFMEEPIRDEGPVRGETHERDGVVVIVPHLPRDLSGDEAMVAQREVLETTMRELGVTRYLLWYCTPMALRFTRDLMPRLVVYDCMDELSAFSGAPPQLRVMEAELFHRADLVFCGGQSLYESKRQRHSDVFLFPSSVDVAHFARAREITQEPPDQHSIPHPRLGFFGVIDERMDRDLLSHIADARPDWQIVMIGPVAKIEKRDLPIQQNIHYLGAKSYKELPGYLAGWNVALLPFALNESTRFISPTKTPEYLAAGRPVVSTPITDVVRPYGEMGLVRIGATADEFVSAIDDVLKEDGPARQARADAFLARLSWDETWRRMLELIEERDRRVSNTSSEKLDPIFGQGSMFSADESAT